MAMSSTSFHKGHKLSYESVEKIKVSLKGKRNAPSTEFKVGDVPWNKGKNGLYKHTDEWKKEKSLAMKANKSIRGENSPSWKGGKKKCKICDKQLASYTANFCKAHVPHTKERNEKISISKKGKKRPEITGEKNFRWIEDRDKLKDDHKDRGGQLHREWSRIVKSRDKWKCRIDSEDCFGKIEAHHILSWSKHPELRYEVNNGITLCHYHHPRKREEEQRLAPTFQKMVLRPIYELATN